MQKGYSHALHTYIYIEYARHGEIQGCFLALGTWHFWHLAFGNWQLALGTFGTCHFWHLALLALLALLASRPFFSDVLIGMWE